MSVKEIREKMKTLASLERAELSQRFFKTGKGEYGEGDVFIGLSVPDLRKFAREYQTISEKDLLKLLKSPIHEERLLSLLILCLQYAKADEEKKEYFYGFYLSHTKFINNWDLIDTTAPYIVGAHLLKRDRNPLFALAKSANLWERRIAIISTFYFIRQHDFDDALKIAELLLADKHDLIHKAVGWMLREIGKRNRAYEEAFLQTCYKQMPRTMLRYAIERFEEETRQQYLTGKV